MGFAVLPRGLFVTSTPGEARRCRHIVEPELCSNEILNLALGFEQPLFEWSES